MDAIVIELFDVPPSSDDEFVDEWRAARAGLGPTLYRSLRDEARLRYVGVCRGVDAVSEARYEVVHADGDVDGHGGVTLIAPHAVVDEGFRPAWQLARDAAAGRRGYLGTRLCHATGLADVPFIAFARWSSPLMVARARQALPPAVAALAVPPDARLYQTLP